MVRNITISILFILLFGSAFAGDGNLFFNYSVSEGLVHKTVNCIFQDSEGFIWIGTSNGLSRFDSYNFRNFRHERTNPHSLHGTSVYAIVESKDGRLWISTEIGLEYFDKKRETFNLPTLPALTNYKFERNLHVDRNGYIWVHNVVTGFLAFDPQSQEVKRRIADIPGIPMSTVYQFAIQNDTLWFGAQNGIASYSYQTKQVRILEKRALSYSYMAQKTDDTTLVLSFMQEGIYVINTATKQGRWATGNTPLLENGIKTIFFDATYGADHSLWAGVTQGIMNVSDGHSASYHHFSQDNYFDGGWVTCVYRDRSGNMLFGTNENGMYIKKETARYFKTGKRLYTGEIGKTEVTHFNIFDNGSMLYCNHQGVYSCPDYKRLVPGCAQLVSQAPATSIYDIGGQTCLLNSSDTVFTYDSRTRKLTRMSNFLANSCACKTGDGMLWFGSWLGMIFGYNTETKKTVTLYADTVRKQRIGVFCIYGDEDGSIWIGTIGSGLLHIQNPASSHPQYDQYTNDPANPHSIGANIIHSICSDQKGNLWIATNGGGASRMDLRTKRFENFGSETGIGSNIVESVIADRQGNIWFTSNILTKYDPVSKTFLHYSESDGVGKSFIAKSAKMTNNGDIVIGNNGGLLVFNPDNLPQRKPVQMPQLTALRIRGVPVSVGDTVDGAVPYSDNITYSDKLTLNNPFNSFSIEFASIGIEESKNTMYQYMLEGLDRDWIPADTRSRLATYSGLQPGQYVFKVRASNQNGKWTEPRTVIVEILPSWWQSVLFKVLFSLTITLALAAAIWQRVQTLKNRNIDLEETVRARTVELLQKSAALQDQSEALSQQAISLEYRNKELQEKQLVIEMKNVQLEEALGAKDKLIGVIAHDFKNPLTAIQGLATLLRNGMDQLPATKLRSYADHVYEASENLKNQMLVVLDWAQSRVADLVYTPIEINIETIIDDAILLVKESSSQKKIAIETQLDYESNAFIDPRMMSTVMRNLLINAIKFTSQGGTVTILVQEYDSGLEISVIDSGVGMSQEAIDRLFATGESQSRLGTESETGAGLGLQLCRSYIKQNHGTIHISSTLGVGSVFSVSVPKGNGLAIRSLQVRKQNNATGNTAHFVADKNQTLLLVDDDAQILNLLKGIFEPYYNVVCANGGTKGVELARNAVPQLIISDISMPDMTGIELCQAIKTDEMTSHIPVILLTADKESAHWRSGYSCGADDYIEKPFDKDLLLYKVHSLLENRKKIVVQQRTATDTKGFLLPDSYDDALIKRVLEYVNLHFSDALLDINMIADAIGVSRTQLWRKFKAKTDTNLSDYILELRMEKAKEMLLCGRYKVAEVAYDVGYSNPQYFTKCFSQYFGDAPREFADKMKVLRD